MTAAAACPDCGRERGGARGQCRPGSGARYTLEDVLDCTMAALVLERVRRAVVERERDKAQGLAGRLRALLGRQHWYEDYDVYSDERVTVAVAAIPAEWEPREVTRKVPPAEPDSELPPPMTPERFAAWMADLDAAVARDREVTP